MEESEKTTEKREVSGRIWRQSFLTPLLGTVLGGILGFLYYYFIGCTSGSCAITSNPILTVLLGAFLGFSLMNCPGNKC